MAELDRLMKLGPRRRSEEGERLELLALIIEDYEKKAFPVRESTPQEIVEFFVDQHDLTAGDLAKLMGGRSSLSLFRKGRPLSLGQIKRLRERLHIPPALLLDFGE